MTKCPARLHTCNGVIIKQQFDHSHQPDAREILKCKLRNKLKQKAIETTLSRRTIATHITNQRIPNSVIASMPSVKSMMDTVSRLRRKNTTQVNYRTTSDLIIEHQYTVTSGGDVFLLHDSGQGDERVLIYASERNLKLLSKCTTFFMDGTFDVVPEMFTQLFTIHGISFIFINKAFLKTINF